MSFQRRMLQYSQLNHNLGVGLAAVLKGSCVDLSLELSLLFLRVLSLEDLASWIVLSKDLRPLYRRWCLHLIPLLLPTGISGSASISGRILETNEQVVDDKAQAWYPKICLIVQPRLEEEERPEKVITSLTQS